MTDIETQRLANLAHKEKLLAELNLNSRQLQAAKAKAVKQENGQITKKRKVLITEAPTRSSARLQGLPERPSYKDDPDIHESLPRSRASRKQTTRPRPASSVPVIEAKLEPAVDAETIRDNWTNWEATAEAPTRDDQGTLHFSDYPTFLPNKSPEEMVREGSFGGSYWRPIKSRRLGIIIEDDWKELPHEWINELDVERYLTNPEYDPDVNKYKVACGQSIEEWEASGWIAHEYDVRGWFQWYCRFFQGRRCDDDDRQVSRWRKCVGETGRWKRMLLKKYLQMGVKDVFDDGEDEESREVSPVMHQTCHHWAYEIKQHDLDGIWKVR
ncbi:hypothetical protein H2198_001626 [Neophaeococcomyces mojaviensis]|uniref:Uncharacterized protein n=1 Tax=Neophaeococcomyces mojaviensis TaxID=3383035 RepID=A0ACC3AGL5_9EURO|nr:hypothetical protein H2198_001626 [Knufia sp. JES_112]